MKTTQKTAHIAEALKHLHIASQHVLSGMAEQLNSAGPSQTTVIAFMHKYPEEPSSPGSGLTLPASFTSQFSTVQLLSRV